MNEHEQRILELYEMMTDLSDELGADGHLRKIDDETAEVALQFDVPMSEETKQETEDHDE